MTNKKLVGVRDPFGIRPLVIGKLKILIFSHLKLALDIVGATLVREVENGEIVIENDKINSIKPFPNKNHVRAFLNIFISQDQIALLEINVLTNIEKT